MSGDQYLLDSNVIIRLSKQDPHLIDFVSKSLNSAISVITYMEVLGYHFSNPKELLTWFELIHIDHAIADQAIKIRQMYKIKLPDAIIAATAQICKLTLVTGDTTDFKNIKNLEVMIK
ncbi:MAG: type II toxin-antitoxin system VapC family toxin [Gammaproteobacteria bacterium]|nr:type II toxin-antitoxin system VapC family toxin [Gammaproteobacteria bacterium]